MKTKILLSSASVLAVLFIVTVISVGEVSAATGDIKNLFPPGNNGTVRGVGMIDGHDGNKYVFQTPGDNGDKELNEGDEVFFELGDGRTVDNVTQESDNPISEAGLIDEIKDGDTVEFVLQEGKKGLNAVNVKVLSRDRSKPMREWVQANIVGREMVMPGDNVAKNGNIKHSLNIQLRIIGDIIQRVQETLVGCELDVCAQVRKNADARHGLIEEAGKFARDGDLDEVERTLQEVQVIVAGDIERIKNALEHEQSRELSDDDRKKLYHVLLLEEQLDWRIEGLLQVLEKGHGKRTGRNPQTGKEIKIAKADAKRAFESFANARATDPTDSDGDGYGDARSYPIREGGHTIKPGQ